MVAVNEFSWEEVADPAFGTQARQAFRQALDQLAQKAKGALPESAARVDKAVALVLAGDVVLGADHTALVRSQTGATDTYEVRPGFCPCKDFASAPQGLCKHRLGSALLRRALALTRDTDEAAPAAPVPSQAPAADTIPLPEAPASANCHITIAGRQVQMTLRDTDETRLLARLTALLAQYPLPEAPLGTPEGWCALHQVQMPLNTKEGRSWYSHRRDDGSWCRGKARRGA